ncbi:MAG TPA: TadE/TadG family type IV pilus assembly protein [Terracidiphilus sp.]|jgi:Flp pilus assembly protein TadG
MKILKDENGNVLTLIALSLTLLMGMIALATDVGMLYRTKRMVQKAADSGALLAAAQIKTDTTGQTGANTGATQNGLTLGSSSGQASVTAAVQTANSTTGFVQVKVTQHSATIFMPILGSKFKTIDVSAVAAASYKLAVNDECMLGLSQTGAQVPNASGVEVNGSTSMVWNTKVMSDVSVQGSSKIKAPNCGVQACGPASAGSGSTAAAIYAWGSGNIVAKSNTAPSYGTDNSGSKVTTTPILKGCAGDPLASSMPTKPTAGTCIDPSWMVNHNAGGAAETIGPGTYCNFNTSNVSTLTMTAGTYIITKTFSTNSGTTINGSGVTIFLANGAISNSGNNTQVAGGSTPYGVGNGTTMNISAPTSGSYSGIAIWDGNSSASTPDTFTFGGGASSSFTGAIYAPNTNLMLGNGSGTSTMSSNIIANTITVVGGSTVTNNYNPSSSGSSSGSSGVTLAQ